MSSKLQTLLEMKKLINKEIIAESRKSKRPAKMVESLGKYLTDEEAKYLANVVTNPDFASDREYISDDDSLGDNGKLMHILDAVFDNKSDEDWGIEIDDNMDLVFYYSKFFDQPDEYGDDRERLFIILPEGDSKEAWDAVVVKLMLAANSEDNAIDAVTKYFEKLIEASDGEDYKTVAISYGDNSLLDKALKLDVEVNPVSD